MTPVVLDAATLVIYYESRLGSKRVEELLQLARAGKRKLFLTVVNWGEVYYSLLGSKGRDAAQAILFQISQLPIEVVGVGIDLAKLAAEFHWQYQLPYADCFAAALAQLCKGRLVTSDRDFRKVQQLISVEFLPAG